VAENPLILAHDLGTTGNKATLFDLSGAVVASAVATYQTVYPQPNWAEQDPADWQQAVFGATQRLLSESHLEPERIAVVSFSGHMQGVLAVNRAGAPLRPAIIWADQRATAEAEFISQTWGQAEIYQLMSLYPQASLRRSSVEYIPMHLPFLTSIPKIDELVKRREL